MEEYFDDYVLFWPLVHDAPRLPMAVHVALRALEAMHAAAPLAEMLAQARQIAELESQPDRQLALGLRHFERVGHAKDFLAVSDSSEGGATVSSGHGRDCSIRPVRQWLDEIKHGLAGPLKAARALVSKRMSFGVF